MDEELTPRQMDNEFRDWVYRYFDGAGYNRELRKKSDRSKIREVFTNQKLNKSSDDELFRTGNLNALR